MCLFARFGLEYSGVVVGCDCLFVLMLGMLFVGPCFVCGVLVIGIC